MAKEMLFSVVCPTCEAKIGVHDKRLVGQLVQCPKCGSIVLLRPPKDDAKSQNSSESENTSVETKETAPPQHPGANTQPLTKREDRNAQPPLPNHAPAPVPPQSVPVPPPVSIPVPPPATMPEPMSPDDLVPEPMSPGALNSNSSQGGKSISQRLSGLTDRLPSWTPYLVIGLSVIVLLTLLVLFLFRGSNQKTGKTENNTDKPVVENKNNKGDDLFGELTNVATDDKDKKNGDKKLNEENSLNAEDKKDSVNENNNLNEKDNVDVNAVEDAVNGRNDSAIPVDDSPVDDTQLHVNTIQDVTDNSDVNVPSEEPEKTETLEENPALDNSNPFIEVKDNDHSAKVEDNNGNESDLENVLDNVNNEIVENEGNEGDSKNDENEASSVPGLDIKLKSISIRELKLSQCLQTIRELGALPIEVNWGSLRRNGVNADDKISWSGNDVTLKTVLSEVLAQRGLMFKISDEEKIVFVPRVSVNARSDSGVNPVAGSGSTMVKTQYSVADLVGRSPEKTAELIKSIREFLCPGDWKEVGGTGTIAAAGGGSIVITQSQQNQWIIADFLDRLRLARHLAPLHNRDVSLEPMTVRAQSALKRNVGINFQPAADLKTALSEIGQRIGVSILLDEPSLKIAGISAQFPISFDARELSLEDTFNRIKEETSLTYLAQTPNSFIVTTPDGVKSMMSVEFFPIADLVEMGLTPAILMEQVVKFEPKSWKSQDAASFGLIDFDKNSDCLIVRQSPSVLSKISELLTQLRARLKAKE
ncbi:MAG: hypothetical protein IJQ39_09735 [Thermoguttaceae bacterium]|nr:hypothetical protein [Thermoguttaceae bacterium]